MAVKVILLIIIILLLILDYVLVIIAHRSDERAERIYREWRRDRERSDSEIDK